MVQTLSRQVRGTCLRDRVNSSFVPCLVHLIGNRRKAVLVGLMVTPPAAIIRVSIETLSSLRGRIPALLHSPSVEDAFVKLAVDGTGAVRGSIMRSSSVASPASAIAYRATAHVRRCQFLSAPRLANRRKQGALRGTPRIRHGDADSIRRERHLPLCL
jgi:hypothetical protein